MPQIAVLEAGACLGEIPLVICVDLAVGFPAWANGHRVVTVGLGMLGVFALALVVDMRLPHVPSNGALPCQ